ncbi:MAG: hypothetical protein FWG18_02720 [Alphaproteobacteria bacterium]|nr:hypothetical protein [Alphaproteobacteria bacterium]
MCQRNIKKEVLQQLLKEEDEKEQIWNNLVARMVEITSENEKLRKELAILRKMKL